MRCSLPLTFAALTPAWRFQARAPVSRGREA